VIKELRESKVNLDLLVQRDQKESLVKVTLGILAFMASQGSQEILEMKVLLV
jgi:hypothetical protein